MTTPSLNAVFLFSSFLLILIDTSRGFWVGCDNAPRSHCWRTGLRRPFLTRKTGLLPAPITSGVRSSPSSDGEDGSADNDLMGSLRSRIEQLEDRATKLPLVVLDAMLPRQVMEIQFDNTVLVALIRARISEETPYFGMLGMSRLVTGQQVNLMSGVVVQIVGKPKFMKDGTLNLELRGDRRFRVDGEVEKSAQGWVEGRVKYHDAAQEEEAEAKGADQFAVARAISAADVLTTPLADAEGELSPVDRWVQLARKNEREAGQIDRLLGDLGEIPPAMEPSERAFWVGALINPLPAMGVAMEIRPALLTARTAEERVRISIDGILRSIKHMDGSARMW